MYVYIIRIYIGVEIAENREWTVYMYVCVYIYISLYFIFVLKTSKNEYSSEEILRSVSIVIIIIPVLLRKTRKLQ